MLATLRTIGDVTAASVTVASLLQYIPAVSAVFGTIWIMMRCYQTWQEIKINKKTLESNKK